MSRQEKHLQIGFGPAHGLIASRVLKRQFCSRPRAILLGGAFSAVSLCGLISSEVEGQISSGNLSFTDPYAFVDRFTGSPDALGFPVGSSPFLNLGMIVEKEKAEKAGTPIDIVSASATNGKVSIDLSFQDIGILDLWDNWKQMPEFDAEMHKGTWVITAVDSNGSSARTLPVELEYGIEMPFLENVETEQTASGDLELSWTAPDLDSEIEAKCDIDYRLRLLRSDSKQFFRSDRTTNTEITVPGDKAGSTLDGVWGRIEMACRDKEEKGEDGVGELESRSNTLFPLF